MDMHKNIQIIAVLGILVVGGFVPFLIEATDADSEKIYTQEELDAAVLNAIASVRQVYKYTQEQYDEALNTVPPGYVPQSDVQRLVNEGIAEYKANAHLIEEWYFYATIILAIALVGAIVLYVRKK